MHSNLIKDEVTILDIKEAREARVQSFAHFAETISFQEQQKFHALRARIRPGLFDDRVDWLRNRSAPGCEKWLFRDQTFCEWLDFSKQTAAWLWLHGIPGAGKTYLCAAVLDHIRGQHRTLFAFVNHANPSRFTALSLFNSFIFQAAEDDNEFQRLLLESEERKLRGSILYSAELLTTYLQKNQFTYIVTDGVDEMEEAERHILLSRLVALTQDCKEVRVLLCSREEDDITRMIEPNGSRIRVHQRNSGSIQKYVDYRTQSWIAKYGPDAISELEIQGLLYPLSAKAAGESHHHPLHLETYKVLTIVSRYVLVCTCCSGYLGPNG